MNYVSQFGMSQTSDNKSPEENSQWKLSPRVDRGHITIKDGSSNFLNQDLPISNSTKQYFVHSNGQLTQYP